MLFDLDCTLADRPASIRRYAEVFCETLGERLVDAVPQDLAAKITEVDHNGYSNETRFEELAAILDWQTPCTAGELTEHWFRYWPPCAVGHTGYREVIEQIGDAGIQLGMITNGSVRSQDPKIDALGIRDVFEVILISEAEGVAKPDPVIFQRAVDRLGVSPHQAWYLGDHPVNDIQGATSAGLGTIWFEGYQPWPAHAPPPAASIRTLAELPGCLGLV